MSPEGIDKDLFYLLALSQVPGVGPVMGKSLIAYCGSAEAVFSEKKSRLSKIPYVGQTSANALFSFKDFHRIEAEITWMEQNDVRAVHFYSPDYPIRLKQEMDSPLVLFVKGPADLNHPKILAIVGTRKCSHDGLEITRSIVAGLKPTNVTVISGLAYGIDITAHRACVENQLPTIAVVAHGLDTIYPGQHHKYARQIVESGGAIVSEHFSGTALNPDLFPRRNRIVAALCDCILVVESKMKGGSMITADIAAGYNRDVFAIPGKPSDPLSEGCNFLIKSLKALLCENAGDIAKAMNWDLEETKTKNSEFQPSLFQELSVNERKIIEQLQTGNLQFDQLFLKTEIPVSTLSFVLLDMEMKGFLQSLPGKKYQLRK